MSTPLNVIRPTYKVYENDYFEAVIESIQEQENKYWNPQKPDEGCQFQLIVRFKFKDPDGEEATINAYMAPILSKKSRLTALCKAILPAFSPDMEIMHEDLIGKKLRIALVKEEKQDGTERNKVTDFAKSNSK